MTTETKVVEAAPSAKDNLRVTMGRQNCEFYTGPDWPAYDTYKKPINYVLRGDGLWEVRQNDVGMFWAHKAAAKLPGFPKEDNHEAFMIRHGKIPYNLFKEILFFFKDICDESKDEVYVQILWNNEEQKYFNYCPEQTVSGGSVEFKRDIELEAKHTLVCEIHSHNRMGAFFSTIDDNDEKGDRFFGVIGKLDTSIPEMKFSFVCGGKRILLGSLYDIFEKPEVEENIFPQEWKKRVTKRSYITSMAGYGSNYSYSAKEGETKTYGTHGYGTGGTYNSQNYKTGSSVSNAGTWRDSGTKREEAEKEIGEAFFKAEQEMRAGGTMLVPRDFIGDSKSGSEVPADAAFFRHLKADSSGKSDDLAVYASRLDGEEKNNKFLKLLEECVSAFVQHITGDKEMNEKEKQQMFEDLLVCMTDEDVKQLAETMVSMGQESIMIDAMNIITTEDVK